VADPQQNDDSNPLTDIELERLKMYQDSFKHMTTLCSGAILLASAVTGALFPKPDLVGLLAFSILFLAVGALAAMLGLVIVARYIDEALDGSTITIPSLTVPSYLLSWMLWTSVGVAYIGLAQFAWFAWTNFNP
jgi:hypothetical protein